MKKFKFSLETVLSYKQQVLEAVQNEHAQLLAKVQEQENVLEAVERRYREYNEEYRERKQTGLPITDAVIYQNGLRVLEADIRREMERPEQPRKQAEAKRLEMVEARKETSSLEKLREKKLDVYQKSIQKSEESLIEEFVTAARVSGADT